MCEVKEVAEMRLTYYRFPDNASPEILAEHDCSSDDNVISCSVSYAKEMMRRYGGNAWTEHIDRDGSCFEVTEVKLAGNNSRFKYNHHL